MEYFSISSKLAVALPTFPTTTAAALFARLRAETMSILFDKAYPKVASTVSPAPVTSKTSFAIAGIIFTSSLLYRAIPLSERVIMEYFKFNSSLSLFRANFSEKSSSILIFKACIASFKFGVRSVAFLYLE